MFGLTSRPMAAFYTHAREEDYLKGNKIGGALLRERGFPRDVRRIEPRKSFIDKEMTMRLQPLMDNIGRQRIPMILTQSRKSRKCLK